MKPSSTLWNQRRIELARGRISPRLVRGYMNRLTHLQIVDKVSDREPAQGNRDRKERMLECRHVLSSMVINDRKVVVFVVAFSCGRFRYLVTWIENLVKAVAARVNLQWIREHDKDCNGQLSNSDEDRSRWVHRNNVGPDLPRCENVLVARKYSHRP